MNRWDEMNAAVREAEETLRLADGVAHRLARLLVGRLRHAGAAALVELKAELRDFNAHTKRWVA